MQAIKPIVQFDKPAIYKIRVTGKVVTTTWSQQLANMQVVREQDGDNEYTYLLIGMLSDQAELNGVLNTLYDLHLSIISVKTLTSLI